MTEAQQVALAALFVTFVVLLLSSKPRNPEQ
jgi:hypothetical protein